MTENREEGLDRYLIEIRSHSTIPDDEDRLLGAARQGDRDAMVALVESYLALTAEIALRIAPSGMSRLEAVQEANLVLMRVIERSGKKPAVVLGQAIEELFATFS